jgi:RNA recognition motif-containing protein
MDESKKFRSSPDSRRNDRSTQSLSRSNLSCISQQAKVNDDGPDDDTIDNHRLFVGNLTHNTTDQDLGSLFERAGRRIVRADIIRSKGRSRKSKGCGVIEYENAADAQHALIKLSGAVLNGRVVNVQKARKYDSSAAKHGRKDHHNDKEETTIQQCNKVRDLPKKQDRKTGLGNLDPLLFDITQSEEKKSDDFDESLDKFGEDDDEKYSGPRMK